MFSKVAAIQMTSTSCAEENLNKAKNLLAEAAEKGATLAVLPEMFVLQSPEATDKIHLAESLGQGLIQSFLSEQAKKHHLWIVGGTIPIQSLDPLKPYATSLVFNEQGEQLAHYHKMHLFDVTVSAKEQYHESTTTKPGHELCLIDTPIGKMGLSVCYDVRFPEMFRCLFNQGAELFAIPCAFSPTTGKAHFEILMRARAIENFSYVIAACQTGTHDNGRSTYGHSMIVSPWGEVLACLPHDEGVIVADIDLSLLNQIRTNMPIKAHQKMVLNQWLPTLRGDA